MWKSHGRIHGLAPMVMLARFGGGNHSGFDAASAIFRGGTELHFVPHHGWHDRDTSEVNVLERLSEEIRNTGTVTFGKKTALPPGALSDN